MFYFIAFLDSVNRCRCFWQKINQRTVCLRPGWFILSSKNFRSCRKKNRQRDPSCGPFHPQRIRCKARRAAGGRLLAVRSGHSARRRRHSAQQPVPQASVGPAPRSQVRTKISWRFRISTKLTFVPSGKAAWRSICGPIFSIAVRAAFSTKTTVLRYAHKHAGDFIVSCGG